MSDSSGPDPYQRARSQFGERLRWLRRKAGLTLVALAKDVGSSRSTLSDLERGLGKSPPVKPLVDCFVNRCLESWAADAVFKNELRRELEQQYTFLNHLFELERDSPSGKLESHDGLPRLGDRRAHPLALRVHESVPLDPRCHTDGLNPDLPTFVEREVGEQLRAWLSSARTSGGFLVLVGNSSVGKTRLLYETALEVVPDFPVLVPDLGDGGLVNTVADANIHRPGLLVWLDELQRFLPGPYFASNEQIGHVPVTVATIRQMLSHDTPVIIVGTLWPEYARQLRATHRDPITEVERPRYPHAADILSVWVQHFSLQGFSSTERATAKALVEHDPRLTHALDDPDFNVTEALAGARQLVRRYEQGIETVRAALHAAVDARRVGIQGVLTENMLRVTSRGYLATVHTDGFWFSDALNELTQSGRPHDKATAPLIPVPNADKTAIVGFALADYLQQRLTRQRRSECLPEATWRAFAQHTSDLHDLARLAESMYNRMLYQLAEPLIRRLAEVRDSPGYWPFQRQLAQLLARQGRREELRACADVDNPFAAALFARLLMENGDLSALHARAEAGDESADYWLTRLLIKLGHIDEAIERLRARSEANNPNATYQLADLLSKQNYMDEAIVLLRSILNRPEDDEDIVGHRLATILVEHDRVEELRELADDNWSCRQKLAEVLFEQGNIEELHERAQSGDHSSMHLYTQALVEQNRVEDALTFLHDRGDAGDESARCHHARLLAEHDSTDEAIAYLRTHVNHQTRGLLADLLAEQGRLDEALAVLPDRPRDDSNELFDPPWPVELSEFHARHGLFDELRIDADADAGLAANLLAETLADQERVALLVAEIQAGNRFAGDQLIRVLEKQGRRVEADALRRWGLNPDGTLAGGISESPFTGRAIT